MRWQCFDSIKQLPENLWKNMISKERCTTSPEFLAAIEKAHPEQTFLYFVAYQNDQPVGCALLTIAIQDLSLELPSYIRKVTSFIRKLWPGFLTLRIAMTGTFESYGDHFAFDQKLIDIETFLTELNEQGQALTSRYRVLIIRDFILYSQTNISIDVYERVLTSLGYSMGSILPVSELSIEGFSSPEHYLSSLKSKDRYTIRKAVKNATKHDVKFEFVSDFTPLIDEAYPLFLQVSERAKELITPPLPPNFFENIKKEFGPNARMLIARDKFKKLLAFGLIIETNRVMEIFAVGLNYENLGKGLSIYNIIWECIAEAICKGRKQVDLGVTNYFIKKRFGASVFPMRVFYRASHPFLEHFIRSAFEVNEEDYL